MIPALELEAPVVEVAWEIIVEDGRWTSAWQTASGAFGHHRNSANPGESGNIVLSGHHNTDGEVFRHVGEIVLPGAELQIGDEIIPAAQDGRRHTYRIVSWDRFPEEGESDAQQLRNSAHLEQTPDPILTLVPRWPYEGRSHRVVVVAKPIP